MTADCVPAIKPAQASLEMKCVCGNDLSGMATSCPRCGNPVTGPAIIKFSLFALVLLGLLLFVLLKSGV